MEQTHPPGREKPRGLAQVPWDQLAADVLEHADAHDPVERAVGSELAVVLEADHHARFEATRLEHLVGAALLRLAERDADDPNTIVARGVSGEPAPAAAYVEEREVGLEPELLADVAKLLLLRRVDVVRGSWKYAHEYAIVLPSQRAKNSLPSS